MIGNSALFDHKSQEAGKAAINYLEISQLVSSIMASPPSSYLIESFQAFCLYHSKQFEQASYHFLKAALEDKQTYLFYGECLNKIEDLSNKENNNATINQSICKFKDFFLKKEPNELYQILQKNNFITNALTDKQEQKSEQAGNARFFDYYKNPLNFQRSNLQTFAALVLKASQLIHKGEIKYSPDPVAYIQQIIKETKPYTFHTIDVTKTVEKAMTWAKTLKRVIPFYAVKANPDPVIVNAYANLGLGFDCASEAEIRQIITLGVHPDRIIFAQPRKFESSIEFAKECGVKKMVFDSRDELKKMYNIYPEGEYILRIKTNDTHSSVRLSLKFGANLDYAKELIKLAHQMNAKLIGISFHVGSNCASVDPFHSALVDSAMLFKEAKEKYGIAMNLLDIGGGWPGFNDDVFAKYASVVNADLDSYFDAAVNVIAEPGRFLSSEVEQQVVKVIGTEEIQTGTGELQFEYYLSNGVYQSFFVCVEHQFKTDEILADGICLQPLNVENADKLYKCTLWGPSCDSGDKLLEGVMLPKLCTGDYLYSLHTGAYNNAESTNFNGISKSKPLYYFTLNVK